MIMYESYDRTLYIYICLSASVCFNIIFCWGWLRWRSAVRDTQSVVPITKMSFTVQNTANNIMFNNKFILSPLWQMTPEHNLIFLQPGFLVGFSYAFLFSNFVLICFVFFKTSKQATQYRMIFFLLSFSIIFFCLYFQCAQ